MPKNATKTKASKTPIDQTAKSSAETTKTSIEDKIKQLDTSVEWFYGDDFSLDEALAKYRAAADLAQAIEKDLSELRNQVEVLADFTQPQS